MTQMAPFLVGTDIISVGRVGRLVASRGSEFLTRWFTDDEISYCAGKADPAQHYAARLAAKEAVLKVVRVEWDGPIPYKHIEISAEPSGAPRVFLSGRVEEAAELVGLGAIEVSLSHCRDYAVAVALAIPARAIDPTTVAGGERT